MRWSRQVVTRSGVAAERCIAVANRRETVESGLEMLRHGGNAVDAAVAMGFTATVTEPTEASIGGSGFMLVDAGECWSVEFPPRAPRAARPDIFEPVDKAAGGSLLSVASVRDDANGSGFLAAGVPGVVSGLCLAHDRFGRLPRAQLMEPAIALAEDGFEVDAYYALQALHSLPALRANPAAAKALLIDGLPPCPVFATQAPPGKAPLVRQPDLARTLRLIAVHGAAPFYRGEIAAAIVDDVSQHDGLLAAADLESYTATVERPLRIPYRDRDVLAARAPGGGWTVLQALRIVEHFELGAWEPTSLPSVQLLAEALRLAFADRYRHCGDPDFERVPLRALLSRSYAAKLAELLRANSPARTPPDEPWPRDDGEGVGHGTTHFCVIDGDGCAVSCTITAGNSFGSKVVAGDTGVLLDSAMAWFDPTPGRANSIAPGKRPLVNMAPLFAKQPGGGALLAVGASGGRRIVSAVTQVLSRMVDHGMSVDEAVGAPRLDASEPALRLSDRLPQATRDGLRERGHETVTVCEEHQPYSYEFAHPAAAEIAAGGQRRGGIHAFSAGFAAGC